MTLTMLLPYPPSANKLYRQVTNGRFSGRTMLSQKARSYYQQCGLVIAADRRGYGPALPMQGRLEVTYVVSPPDRRKRDLDNTLKALSDSLHKCGVIDDDSQIDRMHIYRSGPVANGAVKVTIDVISAQEGAA